MDRYQIVDFALEHWIVPRWDRSGQVLALAESR